MLRQFLFLGLAIVSIALVPCSSTGAGRQVHRPMYLSGSGFLSGSFTEFTWETTESGQATHLGLYTMEQHGTFYLEPAAGFVFVGEGTWTAANGDQLFFDVNIIAVGTPPEIGTLMITGGTGRFQGATGLVQLELYTDESQYPYPYGVTGSGWCSY